MEQQIKDNIKEALKAYRKDNVLSQDDIASKAGVNVSYINAIENGNTHIGKTAIKDSYYKKVAKAINYQYGGSFGGDIQVLGIGRSGHIGFNEPKSNGKFTNSFGKGLIQSRLLMQSKILAAKTLSLTVPSPWE